MVPDFIVKYQSSRPSGLKPMVVVSKAVSKKAVERNRIRRIVKEAIRKLDLQEKKLKIIVKNNIASLKSYEVAEELKKLLK